MEEKYIEVTDAHAHVFPDKIADKSRVSVRDFYNLAMFTVGTADELKKVRERSLESDGKTYRVTRQLICSPAVTPAQTHSINEFISGLVKSEPSFIGLGTLHPDNGDYRDIIDGIKESGLKGIKFHSDFQRFDIDDPKMYPVYRYAEEKGLPILFHMGDERYDYSAPARLGKVALDFPELKMTGAHMGGYSRWEEALKLPAADNLYFDISSSLAFITRDMFMRFFDRFGYKHFFFGSDFPMWDPYGELEKFLSYGLDGETEAAVLSGNFTEFMK